MITQRKHLKLAFVIRELGYKAVAWYVSDSQHAYIVLWRNGRFHRAFEYQAYRIWNIVAHFRELVDQEEEPKP